MLNATQRLQLIALAEQAITHPLLTGEPLPVVPAEWPAALRQVRATFVTLERQAQLRGCIGCLEAWRPLVEDVAANAYRAAFHDPRFPPLTAAELEGLQVSIAVLNPPEPLRADSEAALVAQLRPGQDGLILESGPHRATFLPSVWSTLPIPRDFLRQLKLKAGLPAESWPADLQIARYTTESFGSNADVALARGQKAQG